MSTFGTSSRNKNLKRMTEEARSAAVHGEWVRTIEINSEILKQNPQEVSASNRMGKALEELGRIDEAIKAYEKSLEIEESNIIATRSLNRLEQYNDESIVSERPSEIITTPLRASVFIQETGKTYVTELVRPTNGAVMTRLTPATELEIRVEPETVGLFDPYGNRVGQLEPTIAQRVRALDEVGNQYRAYVVQLSGNTVRIIIREVFRDPEAPIHMALPPQAKMPAPRPYIRDTAVTRDLDPDYYLDEDDTDDGDETPPQADDEADDEDTESEEVVGESADEEEDTPIVR